MSVDALWVWEQLADECDGAVEHYRKAGMNKEQILERGSADFDKKCKPDDEHEESPYRVDYYVGRCGYMDMHLKQNLAALKYCFKDRIPQPLLFVDFGCGPMTSGLALAEILSEQPSDYKAQTTYFGIDASHHMVKKAKYINAKYKLFSPECFKVVQGTQFDPQMILDSFPEPKIVVLCLSFVLAPDTFRPAGRAENIVRKLADDWKEFVENQPQCKETRIIYLNPLDMEFHSNWHSFKGKLLKSNGIFCYASPEKYERLFVNTLSNSVYCARILGSCK